VGGSDDYIAQHDLFVRCIRTEGIQLAVAAEDEVQHGIQFLAEILISDFRRIRTLLDLDHEQKIIHGKDKLSDCDKDQIGDLFAGILLLYRTLDEALLDVIADHRSGNRRGAHGREIVGNILCRLLQIQPHIGDRLIGGQAEARDGRGDFVLDDLIHNNPSR